MTGDGTCNVTSRITYDNGVMVRIVYIPGFAILLFSSIFLVYAILTLLKPLLKIYLSVLFYAGCQLFLVACLVLSLISSNLYNDTSTTCSITEPLHSVGMILPGYAVLAITFIRYLFLKYPMNWRNILRMPYQLTGTLLVHGVKMFSCHTTFSKNLLSEHLLSEKNSRSRLKMFMFNACPAILIAILINIK